MSSRADEMTSAFLERKIRGDNANPRVKSRVMECWPCVAAGFTILKTCQSYL